MATICRKIHEKIEEQIEKRIEETVEKSKKKCKKYPWWDPRGWVCWMITYFVIIVSFVLVTVIKWVVRIICETITFIFLVVQEIFNRLIGIIDFIGVLLGFLPVKYMRLKVFVLTDKKGNLSQSIDLVTENIDEFKRIFKKELNIEILTKNNADNGYFHIIDKPAPNYALFVNCSFKLLNSGANSYYKKIISQETTNYIPKVSGFQKLVHIFVINTISAEGVGKKDTVLGCTIPFFTDFYLVSKEGKGRTFAHELGHLGLLSHREDQNNLMSINNDKIKGTKLTKWQKAVIRNSKYVTFFRI